MPDPLKVDGPNIVNPLLPLTRKLPVITALPINGKPLFAVVANDDVPNRDPVIPCVTVSEPLTVVLF